MTNNLKVSVLIPLYNSEEYIAETIDSCLNQTYKDIEIIIVDDGSTDSSLDIVRQYENKHENIKVETQKNSGAPTARNRAFELSKGSYIQYLDADDLLHPEKIDLQMKILKDADDYTIVFGKWGMFQKNIENVIWKNLPVNKNYDDPRQFLIELWASGMAVIPHLWLIPRKVIEKSGGWDESLAKNQDGEFFARVVFEASKIVFIEKSIGYYRKDNENSISKQTSRKALQASLRSFDTYVLLMKDDMDKPEVRRSLALVYSRFISFIRYKHPAYRDLMEEAEKKIHTFGYNRPIMTKSTINHFFTDLVGIKTMSYLKQIVKKIIFK